MNFDIIDYTSFREKSSHFFDGSLNKELKYLEHHKLRYYHILRKLLGLFNEKANINILDFGISPFLFFLRKTFPNADITVCDIDTGFRDYCKKLSISFIKLDLNKKHLTKLNNRYDLILCNEVIEHVFWNLGGFLKAVFNKLKKNGVLYLQTPNTFSLKNIIPLLLNKKKTLSLDDLKRPETHKHEYSFNEVLGYIKKTKFNLLHADRPFYFDDIRTIKVYRKNYELPLLMVYSFITFFIKRLRIGTEFILRK
jgi:2-polyprenyl-3-methyl-5-hydroxy-6-metoxy-1,4-benzoquinol methylase